jgi:hypothetical protein
MHAPSEDKSGDSNCRVLRRVLGPKMDDATGEWGKLHNEELNDLIP